MEGPRAPLQNEFKQLIHFLDSELRPESKWSLASEYPTAIHPQNIHNMRIITEESTVLSHAVIKPLLLKTPYAIFKGAAIGSVVTHPEHRNKGLSRQVIEDCLAEASKQDCDFAILWTDLYDFYEKMNFELCGSEVSLVVENEFNPPQPELKIIKGPQVSAEAILRIYNQHSVNSVRTTEEIRRFLQIPNSQIYTAWDFTQQLVAYAVEGKGADLGGYVHEWGGQVPAILTLISQIRKEKQHPITILSPSTAQNFIRKLSSITRVTRNDGFLGMIKIIKYDSVFRKIKKAARAMGHSDFVLEQKGNHFELGINGEMLMISDERALCRVLFGPSIHLPDISSETQNRFEKILPMPLWVWGWDSI